MLTKNTLFFVFDNRKHKTVNSFLVVKCVFSIFFKIDFRFNFIFKFKPNYI